MAAKKKAPAKKLPNVEWLCVRKCFRNGRVYKIGDPLMLYPFDKAPSHFKKKADIEAEKARIAKEKKVKRLKEEVKLKKKIADEEVGIEDVAKEVELQTEAKNEANRKALMEERGK